LNNSLTNDEKLNNIQGVYMEVADIDNEGDYIIDESDLDINLSSGSLIEDGGILDVTDVEGAERLPVGHDKAKYNVTGDAIEIHPKVKLKDIKECLLLVYRESTVAPTGFMRFLESLEVAGVTTSDKELKKKDDKVEQSGKEETKLPLYIYMVSDAEVILDGVLDDDLSVQLVVSKVGSPDTLAGVISKIGETEGIDKGNVSMELKHYINKSIKKYSNFKINLDYRH
jgi:hypothetical protein